MASYRRRRRPQVSLTITAIMIIIVVLDFNLFVADADDKKEPLLQRSILTDDDCYRCICAASSGCRRNARCRVIEPDKYLCGPFRLSERYWFSSFSRHNDDNPFAFETCALSLECAIATVRQFFHQQIRQCPSLIRTLELAAGNRHDQCRTLALVHYQAIFGADDQDDDDAGEPEDERNIQWNDCHQIEYGHQGFLAELERLWRRAPATRADDRYWDNFHWCSKLYLETE